MAGVRFVKGGRLVDRDEAARSAVLVAGDGISEPSTVHAFADEEAFRAWAAASPTKRRLRDVDALLARSRSGEAPADDAARAAERHRDASRRAGAALCAAGERLGVEPTAEAALRRMTSQAAAGEDRFASLMVLFDGYALEGGWRAVTGVVPRLDWIDFDDRTSSLWVAGAGVLAQDAWFGRQRLYVLGAPFVRVDSLREYGFDNRASSAAVL